VYVLCEPAVALQAFSAMEWDDEKCLNLTDIYKNTPILWDPKDKHLKEDAWAGIGVAMNTTGANCKQKMVTLLASHRREKMKMKKSMGTGKGNFIVSVYSCLFYLYTITTEYHYSSYV
jgi:hypothetical protein